MQLDQRIVSCSILPSARKLPLTSSESEKSHRSYPNSLGFRPQDQMSNDLPCSIVRNGLLKLTVIVGGGLYTVEFEAEV